MAGNEFVDRIAAGEKWSFIDIDGDLLASDGIGAGHIGSEDRDAKTS